MRLSQRGRRIKDRGRWTDKEERFGGSECSGERKRGGSKRIKKNYGWIY